MTDNAYTQTLRQQNTIRERLIERIDMIIYRHRQRRFTSEASRLAEAEAVLSCIQIDIRETTERMLNQP